MTRSTRHHAYSARQSVPAMAAASCDHASGGRSCPEAVGDEQLGAGTRCAVALPPLMATRGWSG